MRAFLSDLFALLGRHARTLLIALGVAVVVAGGAAFYIGHRMEQGEFCDSCHYMAPYVRHWRASGHAEVACVKCHDYGLGDLTLAAVRYLTNTYDMRPRVNIRDERCLTEGCHAVEDLKGMVEYRRGILFDHTEHLEKPLRGERLRCTSCHNQIVQYDESITQTHMEVNDRACFVCHFKDAGIGEAITGCDACHGMPRQPVEHGGFTFDHEPYLKLEVECKQCHTRIVKGDASVPEGKCFSCHVERSREAYTREQLHAIHVTENGIDCFRCHTDIRHGNYEMVSALEIRCEDCHLRQHNRPKQLYMGIGGRDTLDIPSAMFAAQVSCVGCHTHLTPEGEPMSRQAKREAQRASCVMCHGEGYDLMFDNWLEGSRRVLREYGQWLKQVRSDLSGLGGARKKRVAAREALSTAEFNYAFVRDGKLPHNIQYSLYLLRSSAEKVRAAFKTLAPSYRMPSPGAALQPEQACRVFCHGRMAPPEVVPYQQTELPHQLHIEDMELACSACHPVERHGETQIDRQVCEECHE